MSWSTDKESEGFLWNQKESSTFALIVALFLNGIVSLTRQAGGHRVPGHIKREVRQKVIGFYELAYPQRELFDEGDLPAQMQSSLESRRGGGGPYTMSFGRFTSGKTRFTRVALLRIIMCILSGAVF